MPNHAELIDKAPDTYSMRLGRVLGRAVSGGFLFLALVGAKAVFPAFDMPAWFLFAGLWVGEAWASRAQHQGGGNG